MEGSAVLTRKNTLRFKYKSLAPKMMLNTEFMYDRHTTSRAQ